ncbi:peptide chain release factor N(5)-glutamine methyltransferase [Rickettsiales bacterium]|nr:peptide chain release factor N(5)-glutamine methyltransferase [Rickettsiales bacterium]
MQPTIKNIILKASKELKANRIDTFAIDSQILLGHAINKDRSFVICNPEFAVNPEQMIIFENLIKRRLAYEPVSLILGQREFYSRDFIISKDVLDPRPDTELLIDTLKNTYDKFEEFSFLDIGTGSGNITCTILAEFTKSYGFCIDISKKALKIAQKNIVLHKLENRVEILQSNIFENISKTHVFDLIISNPPYIPSKNIELLANDVKDFDPKLALDGGKNGLEFYEKISKSAKKHLKRGGFLLFEIGFDQKDAVLQILQESEFKNIQSFKDLANNDRAIIAQKTY